MIAKNKIIPPISRMGGKSKLKEKIITLMPPHTCYVEVFFGAGWVYFSKQPSKCEAINDKDLELINLFRILKNHPEELERQLSYEFSSREKFYEYRYNLLPTIMENVAIYFGKLQTHLIL